MNTVTFSIDDFTGDVTFLVNDFTRSFVESGSIVQRASHVRPWNLSLRILFKALRTLFGDNGKVAAWSRAWSCKWQIDLRPVSGPVIPIEFSSRATAIEFEVDWLQKYFL